MDTNDPCQLSVITPNIIADIALTVWDASQFYPLNAQAFTEFSDSVSASNAPATCSKSYSASVSTNAAGVSLT